MEKRGPLGQKGPLMSSTATEGADAASISGSSVSAVPGTTGKGFFGSIARKKFSKAVNLVKFAMKFDAKPQQDSDNRSMMSKASVAVQMENTYRMEPEREQRFCVSKAEDVIREAFDEHLVRYKYSKVTAPHIIQTLCTVIREKAKRLCLPRYKLVVNVYLGGLEGQGLEASTRCLWDANKDSFAHATYRGNGYYAIGTVHAVYFE